MRIISASSLIVDEWETSTSIPPAIKSVHDSIINTEDDKPDKPFTRFTASTFLILGYAASLAAGLFVGSHAHYVTIFNDLPYLFGQHFRLDLLFYPPIAVLIVDTMHTVASKID